MTNHANSQDVVRRRLRVEGCVQGMGFRPTVYRMANARALSGFVANKGGALCVEAEGDPASIDQFLIDVRQHSPDQAVITRFTTEDIPCVHDKRFIIEPSMQAAMSEDTLPLPDIATCEDCVAEIFDAANRRYRYAFNNCVNCGPRYTIQHTLPYDRANTSMHRFTLCSECEAEYNDPDNRRFHAQPIACPNCGPALSVADRRVTPHRDTISDPINHIVDALKSGAIVAIKGIGGFQLITDACNDNAIAELRKRKRRPHKPFAVMMATTLEVCRYVNASVTDKQQLESPQAPIVLIPRYTSLPNHGSLSNSIAPDNACLGIMLPYSPLHHLLLNSFGSPLVVTSANLSGEPLIADNDEALAQLDGIADVFLLHDRAVVNPVDDSVVQVIAGRAQTLRLARGLAPIAIATGSDNTGTVAGESILALGGHGKSSVAIASAGHTISGPYIGDLDSVAARSRYRSSLEHMEQYMSAKPAGVVCDSHPDYFTSQFASEFPIPVHRVQHHLAHAYGCMAEHALSGPVSAIVWDGTGFGDDDTIWGGECFHIENTTVDHRFSLMPFPLPGGEVAVHEPRRCGLGILYTLYGDDLFTDHTDKLAQFSTEEQVIIRQMLNRSINTPHTSSVGRLFDAVVSLTGLLQVSTYEAHAPILLEHQATQAPVGQSYTIKLGDDAYHKKLIHENLAHKPSTIEVTSTVLSQYIDWRPMLSAIIKDIKDGVPTSVIARQFHTALSRLVVQQAEHLGNRQVILSGGCFQNRLLTELSVDALRKTGFTPHWHERIPPNDGGLAFGQAAFARTRYPTETQSCV